MVSFARAGALWPSGVNVTSFDCAFTGISHLEAKLSFDFSVYYSMNATIAEGTQMKRNHDETRVAEEIVSVLPAGVVRACSGERGTIRFAVRGEGMKLRSIVLSRESLRRLTADPAGAVKIEYLQRDLLVSATRRAEFRYPRYAGIAAVPELRGPFPMGFPVASML